MEGKMIYINVIKSIKSHKVTVWNERWTAWICLIPARISPSSSSSHSRLKYHTLLPEDSDQPKWRCIFIFIKIASETSSPWSWHPKWLCALLPSLTSDMPLIDAHLPHQYYDCDPLVWDKTLPSVTWMSSASLPSLPSKLFSLKLLATC